MRPPGRDPRTARGQEDGARSGMTSALRRMVVSTRQCGLLRQPDHSLQRGEGVGALPAALAAARWYDLAVLSELLPAAEAVWSRRCEAIELGMRSLDQA
jgi:hypothetical protein